VTAVRPWPSIPDDEDSPFYYSSLTGCGALFAAHEHLAADALPSGLTPAVLGGRTYAAICYQRYHASYPTADAVINELELSVLATPADQPRNGPVEVEDFLRGNDQSKQIGFFPLHVACDHHAAIAPGIAIFGEPKFKAHFALETPSWNTHWPRGWSITIADTDSDSAVLSLSMPAVHGDTLAALSPITTYSSLDGELIASRWQINNPTLVAPPEQLAQCRWAVADPAHPMGRTAGTLIDAATPTAMWQHLTPPVAVRYRPFYVARSAAVA
jgi:hypothetical protein